MLPAETSTPTPAKTQVVIPAKPKTHPTQEQLSRIPLDVKETLRYRELEWNGAFDALVKELQEVNQ